MLKWCTLVHAWNQFQRAPPFRIFAACRSNTRMRLCAPSTKLHRSETMLHHTMTHWNVGHPALPFRRPPYSTPLEHPLACAWQDFSLRVFTPRRSLLHVGVLKRLGAVFHAPDALCCAPLRVRVRKCERLRRNRATASSVRIAKPAACYSAKSDLFHTLCWCFYNWMCLYNTCIV